MSARNRRPAKKIRKLRRALRRTPPAYIDLVHWLRQHRYAQTAGAARKMLEDGRVKVDSHVVGRERGPDLEALRKDKKSKAERWYAAPCIPVETAAKGLTVVSG